jgi:PII-like signaling protein
VLKCICGAQNSLDLNLNFRGLEKSLYIDGAVSLSFSLPVVIIIMDKINKVKCPQ